MLAPARSWTALLQLLCVIAAAVVVPALVCRVVRVSERETYATGQKIDPAAERARLKELQPDWVLIGNSMLNSRINSQALAKLSGREVRKVGEGGTQSAIWFLFLKRIVIESGHRPQWVTVFFRETDLTWADFRIGGVNADLIASLDGPAQPEWREVMAWRDDAGSGPVAATGLALKTLLPSEPLLKWSRDRFQSAAFELTELGQPVPHGVRRMELNELFSLANLRHDLGGDVAQGSGTGAGAAMSGSAAGQTQAGGMADPGVYDSGPMSFDASPRASFLPHLIALAKAHGIHLHFHRVKRRAQVDATSDARLITDYMAELKTYLTAQGCAFTDESADPGITADLFADGDHISAADAKQERYLQLFWNHARPVIGQGAARSSP